MILELPDGLIRRARALHLDNEALVAALTEAIERRESEMEADFEEAVAGIERGLQDVKGGRVSTVDDVVNRARQRAKDSMLKSDRCFIDVGEWSTVSSTIS